MTNPCNICLAFLHPWCICRSRGVCGIFLAFCFCAGWGQLAAQPVEADALTAYEKEIAFQDSIQAHALDSILMKLSFQFETRQRQEAMQHLREVGERQEILIQLQQFVFISILILGFCLALTIGFLFRFRYLSKNNTTVQSHINEQKDAMLQVVAHDIQGPIVNLIGLLEMIQDHPHLKPKQQQMVRMMQDETQRSNRLARNLLEIDSLDHQRPKLQWVQKEMLSYTQQIIQTHRSRAAQKEQKLIWESPPSIETLYWWTDSDFYARILDNLITNAIKFSPHGKSIWIQLQVSEDTSRLYLRVRDEGPGISQQDQQKLFQKYQTLTAKPTAQEPSTGLGLAITKALIAQLEGTIQVKSTFEKGTIFTVMLPQKKG